MNFLQKIRRKVFLCRHKKEYNIYKAGYKDGCMERQRELREDFEKIEKRRRL